MPRTSKGRILARQTYLILMKKGSLHHRASSARWGQEIFRRKLQCHLICLDASLSHSARPGSQSWTWPSPWWSYSHRTRCCPCSWVSPQVRDAHFYSEQTPPHHITIRHQSGLPKLSIDSLCCRFVCRVNNGELPFLRISGKMLPALSLEDLHP